MAARRHLTPRDASRRARLLLVVVLLGLVALAGCALQSITELDTDIRKAGLRDVSTTVENARGSVVVVNASAGRGQTVEEAQDEVAQVVWDTFPHRFDRLRVTIDDEAETWSYAELERDLGDRPASLDVGDDIADELNRTTLIAGLGILVAGVVGIAIIALVLVLVLRASRRSAARRPPIQPWMPPGVDPPPGGWAPAPPPGGWAPASAPPGPPGTPAPGTPGSPGTPGAPGAVGSPAPLSLAKDQTGTGPTPPPPPPIPGPRRRDPDARRLGRRPRGPQPDAAHTPPGWG